MARPQCDTPLVFLCGRGDGWVLRSWADLFCGCSFQFFGFWAYEAFASSRTGNKHSQISWWLVSLLHVEASHWLQWNILFMKNLVVVVSHFWLGRMPLPKSVGTYESSVIKSNFHSSFQRQLLLNLSKETRISCQPIIWSHFVNF